MNQIKENLETINNEISNSAEKRKRKPEDITIIAVSKKHSIETIHKGIEAGIKTFGENYINEAVSKIDQINNDSLSWHFIGHLQSNKAKFAVKYFDLIHTVDTIKLATEINKQANKINKIQDILIQINISEEESKSGIKSDEACLLAEKISSLEHIRLKGIMGMPPFSPDPENARKYFKELKKIKEQIDKQNIPSVTIEHLSMGMSQDFNVAIEEGSTMVRIGTKLFGQRK
ncbi:MAG: YggS family pyridoxal phosphate-dependent enzyme [Desulfobacteraceae bacterium]|nr:YggS family pyridoxal phosphate-dependent enzyme [Desulfobacteraceae bacterium]